MEQERTFATDITEDQYDTITDKYITIPPGASGVEQEGDAIRLDVQAGMADWKTPGKSLTIVLTVVTPGVNEGKTIEWYPGVTFDAMGITKRAAKAFKREDEFLPRKDGKVHVNPTGLVDAKASARFVREYSNQGNLRTVLDSTSFLAIRTAEDIKKETPVAPESEADEQPF